MNIAYWLLLLYHVYNPHNILKTVIPDQKLLYVLVNNSPLAAGLLYLGGSSIHLYFLPSFQFEAPIQTHLSAGIDLLKLFECLIESELKKILLKLFSIFVINTCPVFNIQLTYTELRRCVCFSCVSSIARCPPKHSQLCFTSDQANGLGLVV